MIFKKIILIFIIIIIDSVTLSNCTGVDVFVHYLDLNPFVHDSLSIRGGKWIALSSQQSTSAVYFKVKKMIQMKKEKN